MQFKNDISKTLVAIIVGFLLIPILSLAQDVSVVTLKKLVTQRPDLVEKIRRGESENTSTISVIKDSKGRTKVWAEIIRDIDDKQMQKRVDTYTYYATGEIDTINQKVYGIDMKILKEQNIKHYRDGSQPMMSKVTQQIIIK